MFIFYTTQYGKNAPPEPLSNNLALMGFIPAHRSSNPRVGSYHKSCSTSVIDIYLIITNLLSFLHDLNIKQ